MKSDINYHEQSHYYSTKFMRSSKAIGVLWGIFSMCYAILVIVVFMQVLDNFASTAHMTWQSET